MPEEHDGLFDEDRLVGAVGTGEFELRRSWGNAEYDAFIENIHNERASSLAFNAANTQRLWQISRCWSTLASLAPILLLLAIVWSLYLMVTWAVH